MHGSGDGGKGIEMTAGREPFLIRVKQAEWRTNLEKIDEPISWLCHYCNSKVGPKSIGWRLPDKDRKHLAWIVICGHCNMPTLLDDNNHPLFSGSQLENVENLPQDIDQVFREAVSAYSYGNFSSVVLLCRKLIMHVAFETNPHHFKQLTEERKGRTPGFVEYIHWLDENHYIPPGGKWWVDVLVSRGNEENHQLILATQEDAGAMLKFARMLLLFIYEMAKSE